VWVLGGGQCVGCNCDFWSQARALGPLAFGVSQHSSLLADTMRLLGQVHSIISFRNWTHSKSGWLRQKTKDQRPGMVVSHGLYVSNPRVALQLCLNA
jgi:hypothetical protein